MKRVGLRLASALLALSTCVGMSASAKVPVSYAAPAAHPDAQAPVLNFIVIHIQIRVSPKAQQSLEHVDAAAQFDATR